MARIRVLIVDDSAAWRRYVRTHLELYPEFLIAGEACDGVDAVRKAQELLPQLIRLDVQLPKQNGLGAARKICALLPETNILFVSAVEYPIIMHEALRIMPCTRGYVLKSDAGRDLVPAMRAVTLGEA